MTSVYSIRNFIADAKTILARDLPLQQQKEEIADRLRHLAARDDLTRFAHDLGPTDASSGTKLLWLEPPYTFLQLAKFDRHYRSPVHAHDDFWIVACGYRGCDRWDIYERVDDGSVPGHAEVRQVDEVLIPAGGVAWMREPPQAIHSHNNVFDGDSWELVFSAAEPIPHAQRLLFNLDENTCRGSHYNSSELFPGGLYPPPPGSNTA